MRKGKINDRIQGKKTNFVEWRSCSTLANNNCRYGYVHFTHRKKEQKHSREIHLSRNLEHKYKE